MVLHKRQFNVNEKIHNVIGLYEQYKEYMINGGWKFKTVVLDQTCKKYVEIKGITDNKHCYEDIIVIKPRSNEIISVMGISQVSSCYDESFKKETIHYSFLTLTGKIVESSYSIYTKSRYKAYRLSLYSTDENDDEISDDTKIKIKTLNNSVNFNIFYSDIKSTGINNYYVFGSGILLTDDNSLIIKVLYDKNEIPVKNIKFKLKCDIWNKYSIIEV